MVKGNKEGLTLLEVLLSIVVLGLIGMILAGLVNFSIVKSKQERPQTKGVFGAQAVMEECLCKAGEPANKEGSLGGYYSYRIHTEPFAGVDLLYLEVSVYHGIGEEKNEVVTLRTYKYLPEGNKDEHG